MADELERQGEKVTRCCQTHLAASIIWGRTVTSFIFKGLHSFSEGWLLIDECSQIGLEQWAALSVLSFCNVKFIVVGDSEKSILTIYIYIYI